MRAIYNAVVLLTSAAFLYASPLLAEAPQGETRPASVSAWVNTVNARLDRTIGRMGKAQGKATAIFRRGPDGHATDVRIVAATPAMAQSARVALDRLGVLPPLPRGIDDRQSIKLQLLFRHGTDSDAFAKDAKALFAAADAANARITSAFAMRD